MTNLGTNHIKKKGFTEVINRIKGLNLLDISNLKPIKIIMDLTRMKNEN